MRHNGLEVKQRRAESARFHFSSASGGVVGWIAIAEVTCRRFARICLFGSTRTIVNVASDISVIYIDRQSSQGDSQRSLFLARTRDRR